MDVFHILSVERAEPHSMTEHAVVDRGITYPAMQERQRICFNIVFVNQCDKNEADNHQRNHELVD